MKRIPHILIGLLILCVGLLSACAEDATPLPTATTPTTAGECAHIPVTDPAVAATCTQTGLTEGAHCEICGQILTPQESLPATDHLYGDWSAPEETAPGQWTHSRSCSACGDMQTEPTEAPKPKKYLGSAGSLSDRTLLIAIFADDAQTSWDFTDPEDIAAKDLMRHHLQAGVEWLVQQCRSYGVEAEFIYDWQQYPDLHYTYDFGEESLVRTDGGGYWTQESYVSAQIPTEQLKEKYDAQNVIYLFYFNTGPQNTVNSWSLTYTQGLDTELVNVFVRDDYYGDFYYMPAASFAHEIMHCFGAHDLYYASEAIPQAYVDHYAQTGSNDIMYAVGLGDTITQELSVLDAYYIGLTEDCPLVEQWGLGKSSHFD